MALACLWREDGSFESGPPPFVLSSIHKQRSSILFDLSSQPANFPNPQHIARLGVPMLRLSGIKRRLTASVLPAQIRVGWCSRVGNLPPLVRSTELNGLDPEVDLRPPPTRITSIRPTASKNRPAGDTYSFQPKISALKVLLNKNREVCSTPKSAECLWRSDCEQISHE